jgi:glycine/D-amino acid oxidase-like deaminating enzyme
MAQDAPTDTLPPCEPRVPTSHPVDADVVIFGGGVAGLWSLDRLTRAGVRAVLFEADTLGSGQTVASQGIIHGGLKYTLDGNVSESARAIARMPLLWRECLRESTMPHLGQTTVRADWCAVWRTSGLWSQFGMAAAAKVLQVTPVKLAAQDRPSALADCPGDVLRLDEPVIDPASLLHDLAEQHRTRILRFDFANGIAFDATGGVIRSIRIAHPDGDDELDLRPRVVVFAAGEGNGALRSQVGLDPAAMQLRPLHMVVVRGALPSLNGHCTDGAKTRVTITSTADRAGRMVWQVGGQVAEDGVAMDRPAVIALARRELAAVLPRFPREGLEWSSYRVNRAEASTGGGGRPSDVFCAREGNVITAWPTKLALAPRLADQVAALVGAGAGASPWAPAVPSDWPHPVVALPPWDVEGEWTGDR